MMYCPDCSGPLNEGRCDDCNTTVTDRKLGPDPYLVALGQDLDQLEDNRNYRQCKSRRAPSRY